MRHSLILRGGGGGGVILALRSFFDLKSFTFESMDAFDSSDDSRIGVVSGSRNISEKLFNLHCSEILKQVSVDVPSEVENKLEALYAVVEKIPEKEFEIHGNSSIFGVQLLKPSDVAKSFTLTLHLGELIPIFPSKNWEINPHIDLFVIIPREVLFEKDITDNRYFFKRALYLQYLYEYLNSSLENEIQICSEEKLTPYIQIKFSDFSVTVKPCVRSEGYFKTSKLGLEKNNLKQFQIQGKSGSWIYNQLILQDMMCSELTEHYNSIIYSSDSLTQAFTLFEIWAIKRGLLNTKSSSSISQFSSLSYKAIFGKLISLKKILPQMKPLFILREVFLFCSKIQNFKEVRNPILPSGLAIYDPSGLFCLSHSTASFVFHHLVYESQQALSQFEDEISKASWLQFDRVFNLFLSKDCSFTQFDLIITVKDIESLASQYGDLGIPKEYRENHMILFLEDFYGVLVKSLKDTQRVKHIHLQVDEFNGKIKACILLHDDVVNALREADIGPDISNGDEESKNKSRIFRLFWGEKSELRRFENGTICESVFWPVHQSSKSKVILEIVKYALQKHCDIPSESISLSLLFLDSLSEPKNLEEFTKVNAAYESLSSTLRTLSGLPLSVHSVMPNSSILRETSFSIPQRVEPNFLKTEPISSDHVIEIVLEFEPSSKWPDHLPAIERIRLAFLIAVAKKLNDQAVTTIVSDDGFLDILHEGYCFRVFVFYQRELALRKAERDLPAFPKTQSEIINKRKLDEMELRLELEPKLFPYLRSFALKYSAFKSTVRAFKSWLNSVLLLNHFSEIAIDLLVAFVFIRSTQSNRILNSPIQGLRKLFEFFADWDFDKSPVVVDFDGDLSEETRDKISTACISRDKINQAVFISHKFDLVNSRFTSQQKPSKFVLSGLKKYSKRCVNILKDVFDSDIDDLSMWNSLYTPNLFSFDLYLTLNHDASCIGRPQNPNPAKKDLKRPIASSKQLSEHMKSVRCGFFPLENFFKELQSTLKPHGYVFMNREKGDFLTIALKKRKLEANNTSMGPVQVQGEEQVLNIPAIIHDIKLLGEGILVDVLDDPKEFRKWMRR